MAQNSRWGIGQGFIFAIFIWTSLHLHVCSEKEGDVRLQGSKKSYQGRIEVKHNGQWGTICGSGWDFSDANVFCKQMGYPQGAMLVPLLSRTNFGSGGGSPVWLTDLDCSGSEDSLKDCNGYSLTNGVTCNNHEAAAVVCAVPQFEGCYSNPPSNWIGRSSAFLPTATIQTCLLICRWTHFMYSRLTNKYSCACGNSETFGTLEENSACDLPCDTDPLQICGGNNTYSYFSVTYGSESGTFTDLPGLIVSPDFPGRYRSNKNGEWTISLQAELMVEFDFDMFDLAAEDYVEIMAVPSSILMRFTSESSSYSMVLTSQEFRVKFVAVSTFSELYQGFLLRYKEFVILPSTPLPTTVKSSTLQPGTTRRQSTLMEVTRSSLPTTIVHRMSMPQITTKQTDQPLRERTTQKLITPKKSTTTPYRMTGTIGPNCEVPSVRKGTVTPNQPYILVGDEVTLSCNQFYLPRRTSVRCIDNDQFEKKLECERKCPETYGVSPDKMNLHHHFDNEALLLINTGKALPCDGNITNIIFYNAREHPLTLSIWRKHNDSINGTEFSFVAQSEVPPFPSKMEMMVGMPMPVELPFKAGDFLGLSFQVQGSPIMFGNSTVIPELSEYTAWNLSHMDEIHMYDSVNRLSNELSAFSEFRAYSLQVFLKDKLRCSIKGISRARIVTFGKKLEYLEDGFVYPGDEIGLDCDAPFYSSADMFTCLTTGDFDSKPYCIYPDSKGLNFTGFMMIFAVVAVLTLGACFVILFKLCCIPEEGPEYLYHEGSLVGDSDLPDSLPSSEDGSMRSRRRRNLHKGIDNPDTNPYDYWKGAPASANEVASKAAGNSEADNLSIEYIEMDTDSQVDSAVDSGGSYLPSSSDLPSSSEGQTSLCEAPQQVIERKVPPLVEMEPPPPPPPVENLSVSEEPLPSPPTILPSPPEILPSHSERE